MTNSEPLTLEEISEHWLDAAEEVGFETGAYHSIRRTVKGLLPADARFGIGYQDGAPVILAITDERLFCLRDEGSAGDGQDHLIRVSSLPLAVHHQVEVTSHVEREGGTWLVRSWTLSGPWSNSMRVLTREPYRGLFAANLHGNRIMREAVRQLGWQLPD